MSNLTDNFSPPRLNGKRVRLRPGQESDKAERFACGRDPEFRKMVGGDPRTCPPLTMPEVEQWYERLCTQPHHWVIEVEEKCVGYACLHSLEEQNRRARFAIGLFESTMWGKGYGREATHLVLKYAFDMLKLHRVDLRVLAFNRRAIACYEKCGFVQEGVEREGAFIGGEWQSDVLMSILEHEYRRGSDVEAHSSAILACAHSSLNQPRKNCDQPTPRAC